MPFEHRLVKILTFLSAQFGKEIPLTHQDIADLAGICRELVSKKLHQLQGRGIVAVKRGRIIIIDEHQLKDMDFRISEVWPC
ncbi:MAG: helix-turn-helix domain-containing protein [Dehalococcoidia bacterium]|nr:helix-turn-helix domain-containing protein [Dehalococcoidia bacterium]